MSESKSIAEAAAILGCSTDTVRRQIDAGNIQAFRVGMGTKRRRLAVTVEELERFQRRQQVDAATATPTVRTTSRRKKRKWLDA